MQVIGNLTNLDTEIKIAALLYEIWITEVQEKGSKSNRENTDITDQTSDHRTKMVSMIFSHLFALMNDPLNHNYLLNGSLQSKKRKIINIGLQ